MRQLVKLRLDKFRHSKYGSPWTDVFLGRTSELALLSEQYKSRHGSLVPIYGRRRVGKSELILHFIGSRRAIYYVGKTAPAALQMREFLQQAALVLDEPLLATMPTESWRSVLEQVIARAKPGKLVVALDEFQWMVEASPELPSVLQELWDRHWKGSANVMLILCGSYVGFMERAILGKKSPLFGRRTAQIQLRPFTYREAIDFHPGWSLPNQAIAYFLCGGIPLYLRFFDKHRSIESNIESVILDEYGPLFREPDFLLREELREVDSYYAVLLAIAEGHSTVKTIAAQSKVAERSLPYYLQQLIELGYVARRHPLFGPKPPSRHVRFALIDPLLRFWFRFVFPNMSFLQQMGPATAMRDRIRAELPGYYGTCFERLCREALPRIYQREKVTAAFEVGEFWSKETQIDVVGLRDDRWTDLGECRWGQVRSAAAMLGELAAKADRYPNPRNATIGLRLFVQKHVKAPSSDRPVHAHDLADLYA
jgi:AAA+ ATPase superfamily predicted ATPase